MVTEKFVVKANGSTRVGFILPAGHWLGGKIYLRNLFAALRLLPGNTITPVIFTGTRQADASSDFPELEIVATSMLDRKSSAWLARKVIAKATGQDVLMRRLLQRHEVSVLSHSFHLGRQTAVKTIGWIPDFQHIHLPEFFSPEDRRQRERDYREICELCDKIIASSECVGADLRTFSPAHADKVELLRFVAGSTPLSHAARLPDLQRLYSFSGPYFLLPNQFWAHKNHRVVLSALQILKRRNEPLLVLATGSSDDSRNPSFFPSLMEFAAECDVLDCFRVLGKIPFDHLAGLMQHAISFINPSRFEGWSTSVEEAKSMGKQIVLSDLPVHREQSPDRAFFFPPDDPEALAASMLAAHHEYDTDSDQTIQARAHEHFVERQKAYGNAYINIVRRTLAG
jgi:glycosyltransferase involved in cell wall biosynthesis